jgi:hypothetical protein
LLWRELNREAAVALLKEIMTSCMSFERAQAVSIGNNPKTNGFYLRAKWVIEPSERDCVCALAAKYGVELSESEGYTVFQTRV